MEEVCTNGRGLNPTALRDFFDYVLRYVVAHVFGHVLDTLLRRPLEDLDTGDHSAFQNGVCLCDKEMYSEIFMQNTALLILL